MENKLVNNKGKRRGETNNSRNGSEWKKKEKKKADTRNKDEESWPGPGGKNIRQEVGPSCMVV